MAAVGGAGGGGEPAVGGAGGGAASAPAAGAAGDPPAEALWDLAVADPEHTLGGIKDDIDPEHPSVIGHMGACAERARGRPRA